MKGRKGRMEEFSPNTHKSNTQSEARGKKHAKARWTKERSEEEAEQEGANGRHSRNFKGSKRCLINKTEKPYEPSVQNRLANGLLSDFCALSVMRHGDHWFQFPLSIDLHRRKVSVP